MKYCKNCDWLGREKDLVTLTDLNNPIYDKEVIYKKGCPICKDDTNIEEYTTYCLNCGKEITDEEVLQDDLREYVICNYCGSSTDI